MELLLNADDILSMHCFFCVLETLKNKTSKTKQTNKKKQIGKKLLQYGKYVKNGRNLKQQLLYVIIVL